MSRPPSVRLDRRKVATHTATRIVDWLPLHTPPPLPSARQGHVALRLGSRIVAIGGRVATRDRRAGPRSYANDVLVYSLESEQWRTHTANEAHEWPGESFPPHFADLHLVICSRRV